MKAFIEIQGGSVELFNVNFTDVHTARTSAPGAIVLQISQCSIDTCGNFTYTSGVVSFANNGIDYITDIRLAPFLYGRRLQSIIFKNVNFKHNMVVNAYSNPAILSTNALIYLENFYELNVTKCQFIRNFVSGGIIVVNSAVSLPMTVFPGQNIPYVQLKQHITLTSLLFDSNLGGNSILKIVFAKDVLNVLLQDVSFRGNAMEGQHLISVENESNVTDILADGAFLAVDSAAEGQPPSLWIPPRYVSFIGVAIAETLSYSELIFLRGCANVRIANGEFVGNGNSDLQALQKVYDGFTAFEGFVPAIPPKLPLPQQCTALISAEGVLNMTLESLNVSSNQCSGGICGLASKSVLRLTTVRGFTVSHNSCRAFQGLAIYSPEGINLAIDNMTAVRNENPLGQLVWVGTMSNVTVTNSLFKDNKGVSGTCFCFNFAYEAIVRNVTFDGNAAVQSVGGAIYVWLMDASPLTLHIQDSVFTGNSAERGGSVAVEARNETTIDMMISNSLFSSNAADLYGAAIYVNQLIDFGVTSQIEGSQFTRHQSSYAVLYLMHSKGKLWIGNSIFEENAATEASVLLVETDPAAETTLENVTFHSNTGAPTILKSNFRQNSTFTTLHCSFSSNTHGDIYMEGGVWRDFHGAFRAAQRSDVYLSAHATAIGLGTVIRSVHADDSGGAAHLTSYSYFSCVDCRFENNSAGYGGGALFLEQESAVSIRNGVFRSNSAVLGGSAMFLSSSQTAVSVIDSCVMQWNEGGNFGLIFAQSASFEMNNVTALNNFGNENAGITLMMASVVLTNVEFHSMRGVTAAFISMFTACTAVIRESVFHDGVSRDGGLIYISSSSQLNVTKSSFFRLSTVKGGVISAYSFSSIHLSEVTFDQVSSGTMGSLLYLSELSLFIEKSTFSNFGIGGVYGYLLVSADVRNSVFANASGQMGAALYFYQSANVTLNGCTFSNLTSSQGGAVGFEALEERTLGQMVLSDCHFDRCFAAKGGAIYARNHHVRMQQSQFESNAATEAGVVFFDCTFREMCSYSVIESDFRNNTAGQGGALHCSDCVQVAISRSRFLGQSAAKGGAVFIESSLEASALDIRDCLFAENHASAGGAMLILNSNASMIGVECQRNTAVSGGAIELECGTATACAFAIANSTFIENASSLKGGAIAWTMAQPTLSNSSFSSNSAQYGSDTASFPIKLQLEPPRRLLAETLELVPGQEPAFALEVTLRDHYNQRINIDNSTVCSIESQDISFIAGTSKVQATEGTFTFESFIVYARPNSTAKLALFATTSSGEVLSLPLAVTMRDCVPGEAKSKESCTVCLPGTYSLQPITPCQNCPANAECYGNFSMAPNSGYWRSGAFSPVIRKCPNKAACLGGLLEDSSISLTGRCATGFQGNLCQSCADNYSRTGKNRCGSCPPEYLNAIKLACISIAIILLLAVMVWSTIRSATRPAAIHSVMIRIFLNYFQLVLLVIEFKLTWPQPVLNLFEAQESVGGATEQAYSVDCLLAGGRTGSEAYFRKMIFMSLLPLPLSLGALCFWAIVAIRRHSNLLMKREGAATIIIIYFLILPSLVKSLFSMFSCTEIEAGEFWLTIDMNIRCWNHTHTTNVLCVGLPAIIVWIFGVPGICLSVLVKHRRELSELWVRMQYGFLINGYRRKRFYWEFVILYRKILVICCAVFITYSVSIQALTVQLILLLAFFLQYRYTPFKLSELNILEMWAICVADITIYCGLYYLSEDINEGGSWVLFLLIVIANLIFVTYWTTGLLSHLIIMGSRRFHWVRKVFRPGQFADAYMEAFTKSAADRGGQEVAKLSMNQVYRQLLGLNLSVSVLGKKKYVPHRISELASMESIGNEVRVVTAAN